jgi:hypothetical protein
MTDYQQIKYITERYNDMQGLRLLPLAVVFALLAARELTRDVVLFNPPGDLLFRGADLFGLLALLMLIATMWFTKRISRWYTQNYGMVKENTTDDRIILVIGAVLAAASWADVFVPVVSVFGLALAAITAVYWVMNQRQWHYLAAAVVIAVLSFIPGMGTVGMVTAGAVLLTAVGLADHLMLVRALGPVED